jgi:hypothetical protein
LPKQEVTRLLQEISVRFVHSQIVLDVVPERYTRGIWKIIFRLHSRIEWGLDVAWVSGFKHPHDLEGYGKGLKVIGVEKGLAGPIITLSINSA